MTQLAIGEGTQVKLHFALHLPGGETVDSTFEEDPAEFIVGDGNFLPGFEEVLFGLLPGDEQTFVISAERGFGEPNPNNIQTLKRSQFVSDEVKLEVGLILNFNDKQNGEIPGVITAVDDELVTVDFNHPLAGKDIHFQVKIITVEPVVKH